ncbi:MAG: hypothetical protein ACM3II_18995 [Rhodospirillaceae bacterium]
MTARNALSLAATAVAAATLVLAVAAPAGAGEVCSHWALAKVLTLSQSNGYRVKLEGHQQGDELHGKAVTTESGAVAGWGTYDGKTHGHEVEIEVYWGPNVIGVYKGKINEHGRIEGRTHDRRHPDQSASWYADELAKCTRYEYKAVKPN